MLGSTDELDLNGMYVGKLNLQKYEAIADAQSVVAKIRYKDSGTSAKLFSENERIKVEFDSHVAAIAPGQSAVFYEGDDVLGGGIIQSSFEIPAKVTQKRRATIKQL